MAAVTLVAGCGSSADKKDGASGEQKTLIVGMERYFPPFELQKTTIYRFHIDLANAIGEKMGSKVEVKSLSGFDALSRPCAAAEVAASRFLGTPRLNDRNRFPSWFLHDGYSVVVRKDNINGFDDLKGRTCPRSARRA